MDILEKIFAQKKADLATNLSAWPLVDVKAAANDQPSARGFRSAIDGSGHPVALIAEVKKASPVKGVLRHDFDPVEIAKIYERTGADCLSVLTDAEFFQGRPEDLRACRSAVSIPVLRKDFTVDEYDVWVARALGADAVLLIAEQLSLSQLTEYRELAQSLGMDALVEVHSLGSAELAVLSGSEFIGINNRDLKTFGVDISTTKTIAPALVGKATVVSESALDSHEHVKAVRRSGARAVLIGTAFCTASNIGDKVLEVMGW